MRSGGIRGRSLDAMKHTLKRRGFVASVFAFFAARSLAAAPVAATTTTLPFSVKAGQDRWGKERIIAKISQLFVKVSTKDSQGGMLVVEHRHDQKGGPPRHLHHEQDEWFYVLEGSYIAEVGTERYTLEPGDSVFAPRQIPHAFAFVGDKKGRLLIMFQPAGKMEDHFELLAGRPGFAQDPSTLPAYGMERVGPPLKIE